ncbi:hypothetical protein ACFLYO_03940 [Chloroflexota bacterium]
MSNPGPYLEPRSLWRAAVLGIVVFGVFVLVAGLLWLIGTALGMATVFAFLVATCAAPLLVGGGLALWLLAMPLERRQKILGVGAASLPEESDETA